MMSKKDITETVLNCILLVDDNEFTNIFNKRLLSRNELAKHIFAVKNGQEALDFLLRQGEYQPNGNNYPKPDLILLDINMPMMDGWEFLEEFNKLTEDFNFKDSIIVILTTSSNPDDEIRARSIIKVADYRIKPLSKEMINEIIRKNFD